MSDIKWQSVESSNIDEIGYDEGKKELRILFKSGAEYVYHDVGEDVVQGLLDADSKGKYLNEHIKGKYEYGRL